MCGGRKLRTDRHTHGTTTVNLAAHARRELITYTHPSGFHTGFFLWWGERTNDKGCSSVREHNHARISLHATYIGGSVFF